MRHEQTKWRSINCKFFLISLKLSILWTYIRTFLSQRGDKLLQLIDSWSMGLKKFILYIFLRFCCRVNEDNNCSNFFWNRMQDPWQDHSVTACPGNVGRISVIRLCNGSINKAALVLASECHAHWSTPMYGSYALFVIANRSTTSSSTMIREVWRWRREDVECRNSTELWYYVEIRKSWKKNIDQPRRYEEQRRYEELISLWL